MKLLKNLKFLCVLVFIILNSPRVWAQFSFKYIQKPDGLPGYNLNAFLEDSLGCIWFGTDNGVARYDGYTCKVILPDVVSGAETDQVYVKSLFLDSKGNVWVGTRGKGLFFIKKHSYTYNKAVGFPPDLEYSSIIKIQEDSHGRLWMVVSGSPFLLVFTPETGKFTKVDLDSNATGTHNIYNIYYDKKRRLFWIASDFDKLYAMSENDNSLEGQYKLPNFNHNNVVSQYYTVEFQQSPDHKIWISTYGAGLYQLDPESGKFIQYSGNDPNAFPRTNELYEMAFHPSDSSLWLLEYRKGIEIFNQRTGKYSAINLGTKHDYELRQGNPEILFISSKKDIWIGGFDNGVAALYSSIKLMPFFKPEIDEKTAHFMPSPILAITSLNEDKLLVSTDGSGLYVFDKQTYTFSTPPFVKEINKRLNVVKTLFKDKQGRIWGGGWLNGMFCLDPKTLTFKQYGMKMDGPYQTNGPNVWRFLEDDNGNLWVSNLGDGLVKFDQNGKNSRVFFSKGTDFISDSESHLNKTLDMRSDPSGKIWVAFEYDGVAAINPVTNEVIRYAQMYNNPAGLPSDLTRCLLVDSRGNVWVGHKNHGLSLWDKDHFVNFNSTNSDLVSNDIQSIIEDKNGHLCVTTRHEITIYQFDGTHLTLLRSMTSNNNNEFSHLASYIDENGVLYCGGTEGMNSVDMQILQLKTPTPITFLANVFRKNNQGLESDNAILETAEQNHEIRMGSDVHDIFLDLATSELGYAHSIQFSYQVEGIDNEWVLLPIGERRIVYTGINEGCYTLKVKSRLSNMEWGPVATYKIIISVPFLKSKLFRYLVLSLILLIIGCTLKVFIDRKNMLLAQKQLQLDMLQLEKEKIHLTGEVQERNEVLVQKTAEIVKQSEKFDKIKNQLQNLQHATEEEKALKLRELLTTLGRDMQSEKDWKAFGVYFDQTNQDFSRNLLQRYPNLSTTEIRLAMLIRLNLSAKEIASLYNITIAGVQKSRYRLKKSLNLGAKDDLLKFILTFNTPFASDDNRPKFL